MKVAVASLICFAALLSVCSGRLCEDPSDCSPKQCCVGIDAITFRGKGICRDLEKENWVCNEEAAISHYHGDKYMSYCPCEKGFECKAELITDDRFKRLMSQKCKRSTGPLPTQPPATTTSLPTHLPATPTPMVDPDLPTLDPVAPVTSDLLPPLPPTPDPPPQPDR